MWAHKHDRERAVIAAAERTNQAIWFYGENNEVPAPIENARQKLADALSRLGS